MKDILMHIKFENFRDDNNKVSYDKFIMDLNKYLVKRGASQTDADECVYYYHASGELNDCWRKGLTLLRTVNSLKDEDGKIKFFKK